MPLGNDVNHGSIRVSKGRHVIHAVGGVEQVICVAISSVEPTGRVCPYASRNYAGAIDEFARHRATWAR